MGNRLILLSWALGLIISSEATQAQLFTETNPGLPAMSRPCIVWGDFDGDGDMDVLVAGPGRQDVSVTTLYRNNHGTFSDSGIVVLGLQFAGAAWGDFDGDGDLDLAMIGLTTAQVPTTRIFRNDGNTFTPLAGVFTGVYAGTVNWADYDGDGDLDLLVTGVTTTGAVGIPATRLYRNDGGGVFTSVPHPFPNVYLGAVAWGDYDKDGDMDVVIAGTDGTGALIAALWRNDGSGNFTDSGLNLPGTDLGFAAWADFDSDGDLDLLFGGNSYDGWITRIYRNDAGQFVDANAGLLGLLWSSAAWGDYDNDGDLDLMIMGYDGTAAVRVSRLYRNDAGTFVQSSQVFHDLFLGTLSWADYDNDGDLDLLLSGNTGLAGSDFTGIYRNNSVLSNTPPTAPSNLAANVNGTTVTLTWAAGSDAQTPSAVLTFNVRLGTTPGGSEIVSPHALASGTRLLPTDGNAGHNLMAKVNHLKPGTNYFWSVQAVDTGFVGSSFAAEGTFTASSDPPVAQSIVQDSPGSLRVTWRGTPGSSYQLSASTNLSAWEPIALRVADTNGFFIYIDTSDRPQKFYRATIP
jgi:FG-GAP-like repeat/Fibronectin type III domain